MLNITITPTALYFENLSDKLYEVLKSNYHLNIIVDEKGRYLVKGTPEQLFKVMIKLSYDYDIELA